MSNLDIAKISTDGTHQILILPEDFHMTGTKVFINKICNTTILTEKDNPWQSLVESLDQFPEDFMTLRKQPPINESIVMTIATIDLPISKISEFCDRHQIIEFFPIWLCST